jgi:peptide/nickel transport system substrate-binding protein
VVPAGYLGTDPKATLATYDVAKAKALLKDAGFPNGITVKAIQSTLPSMLNTAQILQAQLKLAGIDLQLETVDHQTFHANIRKDLSGAVYYTAARFPVADVPLTQFFHSRSIVGTPTAVVNFSHCAGRRQGDRRRALRARSREAEGALGHRAAQDPRRGLRSAAVRAAPGLGAQEQCRLRLQAGRRDHLGPQITELTTKKK